MKMTDCLCLFSKRYNFRQTLAAHSFNGIDFDTFFDGAITISTRVLVCIRDLDEGWSYRSNQKLAEIRIVLVA